MVLPATAMDHPPRGVRTETSRAEEASISSIASIGRGAIDVSRPAARARVVGRPFVRDVHFLLAVALVVPVVVGEAVHGFAGSGSALVLSTAFFVVQMVLGAVLGRGRRGNAALTRALVAVAYVGALTLVEPRTEATLPVLYVPIIALAAATGTRAGIVVSVAAAVTARSALAIEAGPGAAVDQSIVPLVVVAFLAVGTRHVVASLERSLERLKRTVAADRRRARRMAAVEELGRTLAAEGTSPAGLEAVVEVIRGSLGYRYPSIYLLDRGVLRLGAQRGYADPLVEIPLDRGVIGRVARTRESAFLPDVSRDPDYEAADATIVSEISLPLLAEGDVLGVLNVESDAVRPLDQGDFSAMRLVADRLAIALELGRERQRLAERAGLLDRLTAATARLNATLETTAVIGVIVDAARTVLASGPTVVTLADASGAYRIAAARGMPETVIGRSIERGEGATGRAIDEGRVVIDDAYDRARFARAALDVVPDECLRIMAVPIGRDGRIDGAITVTRREGRGFTPQEREIAELLAAQAALALANARLHAQALEEAIRDPLTGLHNRRFLDESLARLRAARDRSPAEARKPLAAILFDLDHFGALNKRHGHHTGDAVLRAFASQLARRFRASDLVARYGGEEFLVILEGASRDDAVRLAEEIRRDFEALAVEVPGEAIRATVSAGCGAMDQLDVEITSLIEVADVGLAMAKAGGRNQVVAA